MKMESINRGKVLFGGKKFSYETFAFRKSVKFDGLWRMLRIRDVKGNEIITLYNSIKENFRDILFTVLCDRTIVNE